MNVYERLGKSEEREINDIVFDAKAMLGEGLGADEDFEEITDEEVLSEERRLYGYTPEDVEEEEGDEWRFGSDYVIALHSDLGKAESVGSSYFRAALEYPLLPIEQLNELIDKAHAGDADAREYVINSNLRLVVKNAIGFQRKGGIKKMDLEDLIQAGTFGLMTAVDRFDTSRGVQFSTYAIYWIRQSIRRDADTFDRTIRLSAEKIEEICTILKTQRDLAQVLGKTPTTAELVTALGEGYTEKDLSRLLTLNTPEVELDAPMGDDPEDGCLIDFVQDESLDNNSEYLGEKITELAEYYLPKLSPIQRRAVELRFGLNGAPKMTLAEIAQTVYEEDLTKRLYTRERIRQILEGVDKCPNGTHTPGAIDKLKRLMRQNLKELGVI